MDTVILVVDDNAANLALAQKILGTEYRIAAANSGMAALKYLEGHRPDLILLDISMPQMDGFETMDRIRQKEENSSIPVMFLTADKSAKTETLCFQKGAIDFVNKPFIPEVLLSRVQRVLELERYSTSLESMVDKKTRQVERITLQSITTIANTIDAKDEYTKGHSVRVADYCELIAEALGWSGDEVQNLKYIALLHDIGKIGVPDSVLNKPGKLTDVEFELIKSHTTVGGDILKDIGMIDHLVEGAKYHHERYDGNGYPNGLTGEEIPLHARIVGVADAYDAMSSNRVYRGKMSDDSIRRELEQGRGTQFDPIIVDILLSLLQEGKVNQRKNENVEEVTIMEESARLLQKVISEEENQKQDRNERDYLTRLLTRKAGEQKVIAQMNESDGCLFLIDMDNLKHINDTYGHLQGDYAIKTLSDVLLEQKEEVMAVRFGGDEFLCYMKNANREAAERKIQEMRTAFRDKTKEDEILSKASLSIGACICYKGESYAVIFQNADRALYYVKQTGKGGYYFHRDAIQRDANESEVDLKRLVRALKKKSDNKGSFYVKYHDFSQIYDFLDNLSRRYEYPIQLVMITVQCRRSGMEPEIERQEYMMTCMHNAITASLRSVDVTSQFSSAQHLVVLLDARPDNVTMIINRIFQRFYQLYDGKDAEIGYDVAELEGSNGE